MKKTSQLLSSKTIVLLLLIAGIAWTNAAFSQKMITGTVTSDSVTALAEVTVELKGSTVATLTDKNGNYSIAAGDNDVLVFRHEGYITQEVYINGRTVIDVIMQQSSFRVKALNKDRSTLNHSRIN